MFNEQHIIYSNNTVESNLTVYLNNIFDSSVNIPVVATEDHILIASDFPFNTRYFDVLVPNDQASVMSVQTWGSSQWNDVETLQDLTSSNGASLGQSGSIIFYPNEDIGWDRADWDDIKVNDAAITTKGIYNKYWLKITFSADFNALTSLKYIGYKFSGDSELFSFYPDLNSQQIQELFESGKTDWNKESIVASILLVKELQRKNIIEDGQQLLDWSVFQLANTHKTAEVIYGGIRGGSINDRNEARASFDMELDIPFFKADKNQDAKLSEEESRATVTWFRR